MYSINFFIKWKKGEREALWMGQIKSYSGLALSPKPSIITLNIPWWEGRDYSNWIKNKPEAVGVASGRKQQRTHAHRFRAEGHILKCGV